LRTLSALLMRRVCTTSAYTCRLYEPDNSFQKGWLLAINTKDQAVVTLAQGT
jgi:hypothetical protein